MPNEKRFENRFQTYREKPPEVRAYQISSETPIRSIQEFLRADSIQMVMHDGLVSFTIQWADGTHIEIKDHDYLIRTYNEDINAHEYAVISRDVFINKYEQHAGYVL
jgi:hypothetical protein